MLGSKRGECLIRHPWFFQNRKTSGSDIKSDAVFILLGPDLFFNPSLCNAFNVYAVAPRVAQKYLATKDGALESLLVCAK
jgi:hypothetical protein